MRGFVPAARILSVLLLVLAAGCSKNPFTGTNTAARIAPPGTSMANIAPADSGSYLSQRPAGVAQGRATALEQENQQLEKLLAQSRQQAQFLKEESAALRDELKGSNDRLTRLNGENAAGDERIQSLEASTRNAGGSFQPNNGLNQQLEPIRIHGVEVRMDGDVLRVELLHEKLFSSGNETIGAEGRSLIDSVVAELQRSYPGHIIGIEGHTASDPSVATGGDAAALRRSVAQATAVLEYLTGVLQISPKQLMVVGHGSKNPVFSNATAAGRRRNARVELVIYPEKIR